MKDNENKQISCSVTQELYLTISHLCVEAGISRAELISAMVQAEAERLSEWIPLAQQRRKERTRKHNH